MKTEIIELDKSRNIQVTKDTQYVLTIPSGAKKTSCNITLSLEKEGVSAEIIGLFKLIKDQRLDLTTIAHHKVPHTSCQTTIRGVLMDRSKSSYVGKILIEKQAQQTNSFLQDDTLLLGDSVTNRAEPILEIEADDVRASHSATSGKIDKNLVYYLTTRGLNEIEAKEMIVQGFFASIVQNIYNPEMQETIKKTLNKNE